MSELKSEKEIQARINELEADERVHYPSANVFVNAPLALIQVELRTELSALYWMLGKPCPNYPQKKRNL